jgi:pimeloyl-ACP methyl ester carboxylesterase
MNMPPWISAGRVLGAVAALCALGALALCACQERFIYHPRPLPPGPLPAGLEALAYRTTEGRQEAFLRRPPGAAKRLWILCNGNAALAVDWAGFLPCFPLDDALLLVDYPSYGACEGRPNRETIRASIAAALDAAAQVLGVERAALTKDCGVVGYSLGCAPALIAADDLPECARVVLMAPFTSVRDMAGWLRALIVPAQAFDNRARLASLAGRAHPPQVAIAHGNLDDVIPEWMGRELARAVPGARFLPLPGIGHNGAVQALPLLLALVQEPNR